MDFGRPSSWRTIAIAASLVAIAAVTYSLFMTFRYWHAASVAVVEADLRAALPQYRQNLRALAQFRDLVELEHKRGGRYPVSPSLRPLTRFFEENPHLGRAADFETRFGGIVYISNGNEYKILLQETRDCFIARIMNPDMLDPRRTVGVGDCFLYGHWSPGGLHL